MINLMTLQPRQKSMGRNVGIRCRNRLCWAAAVLLYCCIRCRKKTGDDLKYLEPKRNILNTLDSKTFESPIDPYVMRLYEEICNSRRRSLDKRLFDGLLDLQSIYGYLIAYHISGNCSLYNGHSMSIEYIGDMAFNVVICKLYEEWWSSSHIGRWEAKIVLLEDGYISLSLENNISEETLSIEFKQVKLSC